MSQSDEFEPDASELRAERAKWTRFLRVANIGRVFLTPGAAELLDETGTEAMVLLWRHSTGDWGAVEPEDRVANDLAAITGHERMYSSYPVSPGKSVWVVTETDRSATLVCLPEEYICP